MMPRPIVSAMAFVMKTIPTKFPTAAIATAFVGVRTFVATIVAIAFAASWNPLKKSKEKTTRIAIRMISRNAIVYSGRKRVPDLSLILRHDVAQDVRDIFAVVRRLLEPFRDLLQFDDSNRVGVLKQRGDGVVHEVVRDVLEVMDLDGDPLDFVPLFHVADHADGFLQEQRGLGDRVGELARDWMSSRSMGVMKVRFSASKTSCVRSSPRCSMSLIERRFAGTFWKCRTMSSSATAPSFTVDATPSRRSKNRRSCGMIHSFKPNAQPPSRPAVALESSLRCRNRRLDYSSPTSTPDASSCAISCFRILRFPAKPLIALREVS